MKRKEIPVEPNPHATRTLQTSIGLLQPGVQVSIEGLRGKFRLQYGWDDAYGTFWGPVGGQSAKFRTFHADRVTKIHKEKVPKE